MGRSAGGRKTWRLFSGSIRFEEALMGGTFPRGSTAITGLATYGVGEAPGHTSLELAAKASMLAIADAGLRLGDVDGLFICLPDDFFAGLSLAEYLGLQPRFTDNNRTGGSAFMSHMATAALALSAGSKIGRARCGERG